MSFRVRSVAATPSTGQPSQRELSRDLHCLVCGCAGAHRTQPCSLTPFPPGSVPPGADLSVCVCEHACVPPLALTFRRLSLWPFPFPPGASGRGAPHPHPAHFLPLATRAICPQVQGFLLNPSPVFPATFLLLPRPSDWGRPTYPLAIVPSGLAAQLCHPRIPVTSARL